MTQKQHKLRIRPRLSLKRETVRVLSAQQLTLVAGGSPVSDQQCSDESGCPSCKDP
jgi:hypothetical protein